MDFNSPLDAALRYAAIGWPVFPCHAEDKRPCTEHGFHDATTDRDTLVQWFGIRWPNAAVAVACGAAGLCVIDLDVGKGKDGRAEFARLEDDHGPHWCGLIASTPRGGLHYYYIMPAEPIARTLGVRPGIDVCGDGGYVVLPSPASPGRTWAVGDPFENTDGETDVTQMPDWVETFARGGRRVHAQSPAGKAPATQLSDERVASIRDALRYIDSDERQTWIRVGMALKSTSARDQAYDLWCEWSRTSPKYDEKVQAKQWRSLHEFFADGHEVTIETLFFLAKKGGYLPTQDVLPADVAVEPRPVAKPSRPFPRELMNVPGLVGDVARWMVDSSTRQQHAMCLASSLVTMGAVLGRRVATPTDLRSNVYCLGIGETACGKDPSVRLPHVLLKRAKLEHLIGPGEWKSDSGLRAALIDSPSHAAFCDEFTKLLDAMAGKNAPSHLKGIKRYLLELWAASNSIHYAPAYANRALNKPVTIEQPNLCVYGTGVPSELFSSLDRGVVQDGFLNRILVFFADEQLPERRVVGRAEPPEALVKQLQELDRHVAQGLGEFASMSQASPVARIIPMTEDALRLLDDLERENEKRVTKMRAAREDLSDLWVRLGAQIAKIALIRSASDDPDRAIGVGDVAWARDLVVWCLERTMIEAASRLSDSAQEALVKRVLRIIVESGPDGVTINTLTRRTQWLRRSDRQDILLTLQDSGEILVQQEAGEGSARRPKKVTAALFAADVKSSNVNGKALTSETQ